MSMVSAPTMPLPPRFMRLSVEHSFLISSYITICLFPDDPILETAPTLAPPFLDSTCIRVCGGSNSNFAPF